MELALEHLGDDCLSIDSADFNGSDGRLEDKNDLNAISFSEKKEGSDPAQVPFESVNPPQVIVAYSG